MKYRVWLDYKTHNEADDGIDYEVDSDSAQEAVAAYALQRYQELQHVDPEAVFVRYPDGTVMRWSMRVRVVFDVAPLGT